MEDLSFVRRQACQSRRKPGISVPLCLVDNRAAGRGQLDGDLSSVGFRGLFADQPSGFKSVDRSVHRRWSDAFVVAERAEGLRTVAVQQKKDGALTVSDVVVAASFGSHTARQAKHRDPEFMSGKKYHNR